MAEEQGSFDIWFWIGYKCVERRLQARVANTQRLTAHLLSMDRRDAHCKRPRTDDSHPPKTIWSGPLANNAGGVLIFNLTTDQHVFHAKVWSSTRLRGAPGQLEKEPAPGRSVLCLVVDAAGSPDHPQARLYLDAKNGTHRELIPSSTGLIPLAKRSTVGAERFPPTRTYFLSFDRWNQRIKYGRGYHMEQTVEITWDLGDSGECHPESVGSDQLDCETRAELFGPGVKLGSMTIIQAVGDGGGRLPGDGSSGDLQVEDAAAVVEFDPLPLTKNPPPLVLESSRVQLTDMDARPRQYTFSADLPGACQILYANIAGIDTIDDELADAIAYSIRTEGAELYKKLWSKKWNGSEWDPATDKGKDIGKGPGEFPYLRVTLGEEYGDGPGIPYVLEIWPGRIGESPIHNHGNVCAVIKVLHGSLKVHVYNKMELKVDADEDPSRAWTQGGKHAAVKANLPEVLPTPLELTKGDITWMNANWYQTHRLDNSCKTDLGDFCATIQCYKYEDQDTVRWSGFDWFGSGDGNAAVHLFNPDSDYDYGDMRKKVLHEWWCARRVPK